MSKKYFIYTLGCQMNEYDSSRLTEMLTELGWEAVLDQNQADLLIANTCTVRQLAEDKAFSLIGRWAKIKKTKPSLIIGMIGCLAQYVGDQAFQRAPAIDFLAGPRALTMVPELIKQAQAKKHQSIYALCDFEKSCSPDSHQTKLSDYVAVMDGCDQYCTYCAVPQARGHELSRSMDNILKEITRKVEHGTREIILLGQNITRYGLQENRDPQLAALLRRVGNVPGLLRLRFLTGHPKAFTEELIDAMVEIPSVCEALHLPLQSGSDRILRKMNRGYTTGDYKELIQKVRDRIPELVLTTDFIVGFPGETEEDFQSTLDMVENCQFDAAYCFKYSNREGTAATKMAGQISKQEKEARLDRLMKLVETTAMKRKLSWVGKKCRVLIEGPDPKTGERLQGRTRGNMIVNLDGPLTWAGKEIEVEIIAASSWSMQGIAIEQAVFENANEQ